MRDHVLKSSAAALLLLLTHGVSAAFAANQAPVFTEGANQTVREDAGAQAVAGWATGIGPGAADEAGQALTFLATSDNDGLFAAPPAIGADGTLSYTPAAEASGSAVVTVTLQDDGGTADGGADTSPPQHFSITVVPVNDAPAFTKGPDQTAPVDAGVRTVNGWASAISPGPADESAQAVGFTVTTDNDALFATPPALSPDGTLTFTPQAGATGVAAVTATLGDDGGTAGGGVDESPAQSFTITLGDDRPYAVALADAAVLHCPTTAFLDGTRSFRGGSRRIVSYAWDLHHDGSTFAQEATGPTAATTYGELGEFTPALRVTDDGEPAQSDTATASVTVLNRTPAADAGGPYDIPFGTPLALDGGGSSDPDEGCGDRIAHAWDLDGDGAYDDAARVAPQLGWEDVQRVLCGGACVAGSSHTVRLRATDNFLDSATAEATVTIGAPTEPLTLTWPNGGEFLGTGQAQAIRWVAGPEVAKVRVAISADGKRWKTIVPDTNAARGTATWTPPATAHRKVGRSWVVRIQGFRAGKRVATDTSDAPVGIGPLDLTAAERGAEVVGGDTLPVTWTKFRAPGKVAYAKFLHSLDGGKSWQAVRIKGNPGLYEWPVPAPAGRNDACLARLQLYDASNTLLGRDTGEGAFTILGGVDLTAPEAGDKVYGGTSRSVRWRTFTALPVAKAKLELTRDGGATWTDLATVDGNPGRWRWQVPESAEAETACRIRVTLFDAGDTAIATDDGEGAFTILLKGEQAAAAPAALAVPAASATPGYPVSWEASATPGATYELEEATDAGFANGLRTAYAGPLLATPIAGRANGTTYHYRVRAVRAGMNPSAWVTGETGCAVAWVEPAVGPVTGFTATLRGSDADLAWTNPAAPAFAGVRVVRRTDRAPVGPADGLVVFDGAEQAFVDPVLAPGAYYYAAFAHDASPSFSPAARAVALVDLPTRCEECHGGNPSHPQATNVIDGPLPGTPGLFYNWSGTNPFKQDGGHGDPQGRNLPGAAPGCADCHDLAEPPPGNLHLNGVLESVFDNVERSANTAHLKGEFFARFPALVPGGWSAQVALDNYCAYSCHIAVGTRVSSRVPDMRHVSSRTNGPDFLPDPVSVPDGVYTRVDDPDWHWSAEMGLGLLVANGDDLPYAKTYPMDKDLTTDATAGRFYAPCVSCHDPHGTTLPQPAGRDRNFMVRDDWITLDQNRKNLNLCLGCHQ